LQGDSIRYIKKLYIVVSLKIVIIIANKLLLVLINSSTKVIVILYLLAKNLDLSISKNITIKILTSKKRKSRFIELYSDVEIAISDVKYRILI
jgi:hypothetical protein